MKKNRGIKETHVSQRSAGTENPALSKTAVSTGKRNNDFSSKLCIVNPNYESMKKTDKLSDEDRHFTQTISMSKPDCKAQMLTGIQNYQDVRFQYPVKLSLRLDLDPDVR